MSENVKRNYQPKYSFRVFLRLLLTIFRESLKYQRKTTKIIIEDRGNGKEHLRVEYS
jgi:hypothetical protein